MHCITGETHTHNFRLYTDMSEKMECINSETLGYAWKIALHNK